MDKIVFYKMSGSGNDFIIIDNRNGVVSEKNLTAFIAKVCRRKMSVGADGLILVENSDVVDFKWRFFNSDGSAAEMCGNGARCVSRFAFLNGIAGSEMSFETEAGIIFAQVKDERVKIKTTDPTDFTLDYFIELESGPLSVCSVNTGVPHATVEVEDIESVDVKNLGREIRFHNWFLPAGTNVNFIRPKKDRTIEIRTYERGVEDETLACGTGAVAAAIVMAKKYGITSPVILVPRSGGFLHVYYKEKDNAFYDIYLEGDARIVYAGELWKEAWE